MPLSTSIRDNLLHIITINPEVVVLRRHPPCLLQVPASSSTTALRPRTNKRTNKTPASSFATDFHPPPFLYGLLLLVQIGFFIIQWWLWLHHSEPLKSIRSAALIWQHLCKLVRLNPSALSQSFHSACSCLTVPTTHPLIHRLVFRRCQISVRFQLKFRATSAIIIIIIMDGCWNITVTHAHTFIYILKQPVVAWVDSAEGNEETFL